MLGEVKGDSKGKSKGKGKGDRTCFNCGKNGHIARDCWSNPKGGWNKGSFKGGKGYGTKGFDHKGFKGQGKGGWQDFKGKGKGKGIYGMDSQGEWNADRWGYDSPPNWQVGSWGETPAAPVLGGVHLCSLTVRAGRRNTVSTHNSFEALQEEKEREEDRELANEDMFPRLSKEEAGNRQGEKKQRCKMPRAKGRWMTMDVPEGPREDEDEGIERRWKRQSGGRASAAAAAAASMEMTTIAAVTAAEEFVCQRPLPPRSVGSHRCQAQCGRNGGWRYCRRYARGEGRDDHQCCERHGGDGEDEAAVDEVTERPMIATIGNDGWEAIPSGITIDSGAAETVIPADMAKLYALVPTVASEAGLEYQSATGEAIPNIGEKCLNLLLKDGSTRTMTMQVADGVKKPLGSVSRICAAGHRVVFDTEGSYIMHKETGTVTWMEERNGTYAIDAWIAPPNNHQNSRGFQRQGDR